MTLTNRRTTPALVPAAIEGAQKAGKRVLAADVRSGGVVRVFFVDPDTVNCSADKNTCDDVFEGKLG